MRGKNELYPFLSERWRKHYDTYGTHVRQSLPGTQAYPRMQPATSRADTWPPNGGPPGSDLDFMREQHLDPNGVEIGILHAMRVGGYDQRNQDFGAALSSAINDWQLENWVRKEPRLRGSIHVPQDNAEAAVKEIEKRAGDTRLRAGDLRAAGARAARPPPLLADLRGRRRRQASARAACRRHVRPRGHRRRLAVVLFRAPLHQRAVDGGGDHQPGVRGRVRAAAAN